MRARLPISISLVRFAAAALLLAGCLPGDTRPAPATIHFTVEASRAVLEGVTTIDGWHITFERLLLGLGGARLGARGTGGNIDPSVCTNYANANYERLFDVTVAGRQPLSDIYGLGACGVSFEVSWLDSSTTLGAGVSAKDLLFMRNAGTPDGWKKSRSLYVRGQATREGVTERFAWSFQPAIAARGCTGAGDMGFASDVFLTSGTAVQLPIIVHGESLFREGLDDESPLRFDALAAADTDGDHEITDDELRAIAGPTTDADAGVTSRDGGAPSLEDVLFLERVPRMVRLGDSGPCLGAIR